MIDVELVRHVFCCAHKISKFTMAAYKLSVVTTHKQELMVVEQGIYLKQ